MFRLNHIGTAKQDIGRQTRRKLPYPVEFRIKFLWKKRILDRMPDQKSESIDRFRHLPLEPCRIGPGPLNDRPGLAQIERRDRTSSITLFAQCKFLLKILEHRVRNSLQFKICRENKIRVCDLPDQSELSSPPRLLGRQIT